MKIPTPRLRARLFLPLALLAAYSGQAQPAGPRPDSVRVTLHFGSDNKELQQLMAHVLHIEKLHFEVQDGRLAGRRFHLTYQEYRNGVPQPEKELAGDATRLTSFDQQGRFRMDAFAQQVSETTVKNQFLFAAGRVEKSFAALPGKSDLYSLRDDIWTYHKRPDSPSSPDQQPTVERNFPVGEKVPFLVYTLPYEKDDELLYCSLAQSKVPVADWFLKFRISHFVVYNLIIDQPQNSLPPFLTPKPGPGRAGSPGGRTR